MNALKGKIDDGALRTKEAVDKMMQEQRAFAAALEAEIQTLKEQSHAHQQESQALKQETQAVSSKLTEVLQLLRSEAQQ
jgi:hypothetical protein